MRFESCKRFDVELFVKLLKNWREEKKRLQRELEEISLIPSNINESGVRGSEISEPTARLAIRRLEILQDIEDIERCEAAYERAKTHLTTEELEIFKMFFEPSKPIWKAIDEYSGGNYVCRGIVYQRRLKVLEKLERILDGYL